MSQADLLAGLEAVGVPSGPINRLDQVFSDAQVIHRGMKLRSQRKCQGGHDPRRAHADHDRRRARWRATLRAPPRRTTAEILREIGEG